jgi:hypothetical protein
LSADGATRIDVEEDLGHNQSVRYSG